MGFCDKCAKYRDLRHFSIYIRGQLLRTSRCNDCSREIEQVTKRYEMLEV